jgi:protein ImuA
MPESSLSVSLLRQRIAMLSRDAGAPLDDRFATGHAGLDRAMGGGLGRGRLHELFGAEGGHAASVTGFALMLALCACGSGNRPLLWLRDRATETLAGAIHAPGLVELGLDPGRLILGRMPDALMLLRCAADAVRCGGLGAVLIEVGGNPTALDLTATRRLALAAERSGTVPLLLRLDGTADPSAADTRWSVAPAISLSASHAPNALDAPGAPTFDIRLLRRRSGPDGLAWRLEWNSETCCFEAGEEGPALSGAVPAAAAHRSAGAPISA